MHKRNTIIVSLFQIYLHIKCLQNYTLCDIIVCNLAVKIRVHGTIVLNLKLRIHLKIDSQHYTT